MHQMKHHAIPSRRPRPVRQGRLAVVLALVSGVVLAPAVALGDAGQLTTSRTAQGSSQANQPTAKGAKPPSRKPTPTPTPTASAPHPPTSLYVASSPELPPQFCGTTTPLSRTTQPVFGVSSGAPAYNTDRPNLRAVFEVSRPTGEPVLTQSVPFVGSVARFQAPAGVFTDGAYRVRARAEDGAAVSGWLTWCAFTVDTSNASSGPGVPGSLRISSGPYAGYQHCGAGGDRVVGTGDMVSFAASPTPSVVGVTYPNLSATFEIGHPGQEPLIRKTEPIWPSGLVFSTAVVPGTLTPGSYQFRVRAEDGNLTSAWSPWCAFTVTA
ncbi:hypothetical protein [Acrocarpospora catenulata]|uniref:hypothetical protein n=1 Tax=Acrocarpospora catenulata TaxID=2836182 RepID=UPI001BD9F109|nr:hypothetical protein [Acrocarpospora catenulata]